MYLEQMVSISNLFYFVVHMVILNAYTTFLFYDRGVSICIENSIFIRFPKELEPKDLKDPHPKSIVPILSFGKRSKYSNEKIS